MCGIAGFLGPPDRPTIERMTRSLAHRGPDSDGFHVADDVSLGFRRLSIIDAAGGDQPLYSKDRTIVLLCNGEIYNHRQLRRELEDKGYAFRTRSDCEVIVHGYKEHGIGIVNRLEGMFFIALWDGRRRRLYLVRDRLGKKPAHYVHVGERLYFASEVKAFLEIPSFHPRARHRSIDDYLTLRYVPGHEIMFEGVSTLPPGHVLEAAGGRVALSRYWSPDFDVPNESFSERDCVERFSALLSDAVEKRLMSDVPLGVYLSGGLDSSVVTALAIRESGQKLDTFSHGYDGKTDEWRFARKVARHVGSNHHEVAIRREDLELLPKIVRHMEMPIGNSDIIGFYRLAQEAHGAGMKVILTGEGADELFGSYVHQKILVRGARLKRLVPKPLRGLLAAIVRRLPLALLNAAFPYPGYSLDRASVEKIAQYVLANDLSTEYDSLNSLFTPAQKRELYSPEFLAACRGASEPKERLSRLLDDPAIEDLLKRLVRVEYEYWLPTYHLIKEDKISMAQSIELRFPYLDHELVEFCAKVPTRLLAKGATTKRILRKATAGILPQEITNRPKGPILVPIDTCFGGLFDEMVRDLLSPQRVKERGLFNYAYIEKLLVGRRQNPFLYDRQLFSLLVLETWFNVFVDNTGCPSGMSRDRSVGGSPRGVVRPFS